MGMRYRAWYTYTADTSATVLSSSSSGVYDSPSTLTRSPGRNVPLMIRPYASNFEQSDLGKSLAMWITRGPRGLHAAMNSTSSLSWGPVKSCLTLLLVARLEEGTCSTSMSTKPVALPKTFEQASLSRGLVSMLYVEGLRYTPSWPSRDSMLLGCSPITWLYTLYRGSSTNWTKLRSLPARGATRLNRRVSSWNQMSPHSRRANSLGSKPPP
mmetsp:Transcript_18570/g.39865  ORF Transcript_18570/g.39865 Transcript_18570/m.39865 type:complete len:212 (+) Transcript_18570:1816-2451(+)